MKHENISASAAAICTAFMVLLAAAAYATYIYVGAGIPFAVTVPAEDPDIFQFDTEPASKATASAQKVSAPVRSAENHSIIWIGDSRTIAMGDAVNDGCIFIGASGEGYDWFVETGEDQMLEAIAQNPGAPVVLNLGVNDYDNMVKYLTLYQQMVRTNRNTEFYFLSVNPVDPERCKMITNEEIRDFNRHLQLAFPRSYIDTYTWFLDQNFETTDGIHYGTDTSAAIHDLVVQDLYPEEPMPGETGA